MEMPVYLRWARPLLYLAHRFGNESSLVSFSKWLYCDIADEYRAVLISCLSRIRNQTILFCLSPTNWDKLVDDARCPYERSFLGFCLPSSRGGKRITMQNLRLGSPTALVHLCGIWPPEFYDVIGILVVIWNILVTGFAPASLPLIEATVNSVLYGVWRAWQLTRYLAKALSRCVCCVPPHKYLSRRLIGLRCSKKTQQPYSDYWD